MPRSGDPEPSVFAFHSRCVNSPHPCGSPFRPSASPMFAPASCPRSRVPFAIKLRAAPN